MAEHEGNPAKIYRMTVYIIDYNSTMIPPDEKEGIVESLSNNFDSIVRVEDFESRDIMWTEEIDLNKISATRKIHDKYFE